MKKIGLTGVMGAGKSSVINILKEANITVLDCDAINANLLKKDHKGYQKLVEVFSKDILNEQQELDKQKMSDLIFSDPDKKKQAEAILHPMIKEEITTILHHIQGQKLAVVEVPLLFEVHWESFFDEIWVVAANEDLILHRLMTYRHVTQAEATRRLHAQMSQDEKISRADVVFWNNGDKTALKQQIYDILNKE